MKKFLSLLILLSVTMPITMNAGKGQKQENKNNKKGTTTTPTKKQNSKQIRNNIIKDIQRVQRTKNNSKRNGQIKKLMITSKGIVDNVEFSHGIRKAERLKKRPGRGKPVEKNLFDEYNDSEEEVEETGEIEETDQNLDGTPNEDFFKKNTDYDSDDDQDDNYDFGNGNNLVIAN